MTDVPAKRPGAADDGSILRLEVPVVPALLKDLPGGEPGLVPVSALSKPLEVRVPMWLHSAPTPQDPEALWVFLNNTEVHFKQWEAPVPDADRIVQVAQQYLGEGSHTLYYRVRTFNGAEAESDPVQITVDRTAPVLAGALQFDPDLATDAITEEYLQAHEDRVEAVVPAYATPPRAGDMISGFWDTEDGGNEQATAKVLNEEHLGKPITLIFPGSTIRQRGDGPRMVRYRVKDYAGNESVFASYVTLEVEVSPQSRDLAWPGISEATGSETELQLLLSPNAGLQGVTVVLPASADIRPDDKGVWVEWGTPGSAWTYRTNTPTTAGGRSFKIPAAAMAPYIDRVLPLRYDVVDKRGKVHASKARNCKVGKLQNLPGVQCAGMSGGNLSYASVPASGAKLTLIPWVLISTHQSVTILLEGVDSDLKKVEEVVLNQHRVTTQEVTDGLGKNGNLVIPKALLNRLARNQSFTLHVTVSFNAGEYWPPLANFPKLSPKLIA